MSFTVKSLLLCNGTKVTLSLDTFKINEGNEINTLALHILNKHQIDINKFTLNKVSFMYLDCELPTIDEWLQPDFNYCFYFSPNLNETIQISQQIDEPSCSKPDLSLLTKTIQKRPRKPREIEDFDQVLTNELLSCDIKQILGPEKELRELCEQLERGEIVILTDNLRCSVVRRIVDYLMSKCMRVNSPTSAETKGFLRYLFKEYPNFSLEGFLNRGQHRGFIEARIKNNRKRLKKSGLVELRAYRKK